jgi:hypothetical protein
MVAGMDEVVNPNLSPDHPEQVPEEVDIAILKCRAGDLYENGNNSHPLHAVSLIPIELSREAFRPRCYSVVLCTPQVKCCNLLEGVGFVDVVEDTLLQEGTLPARSTRRRNPRGLERCPDAVHRGAFPEHVEDAPHYGHLGYMYDVAVACGAVAEAAVGLPSRDHLTFTSLSKPTPPGPLGGPGPLDLRQSV